MPGVNHGFIARDSAGAAVEWMSSRFAGAERAERLRLSFAPVSVDFPQGLPT